jgi:hypothetical protein
LGQLLVRLRPTDRSSKQQLDDTVAISLRFASIANLLSAQRKERFNVALDTLISGPWGEADWYS